MLPPAPRPGWGPRRTTPGNRSASARKNPPGVRWVRSKLRIRERPRVGQPIRYGGFQKPAGPAATGSGCSKDSNSGSGSGSKSMAGPMERWRRDLSTTHGSGSISKSSLSCGCGWSWGMEARAFTRYRNDGEAPGTEELNFGAVTFESPLAGGRAVVANEGLIRYESGYRGGRRFVGGDLAQRLSETGAVAAPMSGATEFLIPEDSKRADFFAAIQTGQAELSNPRTGTTAAVTQITS